MIHKKQLPDQNILSVLVSMILLSYSLTHFVSLPVRQLEVIIAGIYFPIRINFYSMAVVLVAGLTASGSAWLLSFHPARAGRSTLEHWLLPGLTSLVLMAAIEQLPFGPGWWGAALVSGLALGLVLTAEYVTLDPANPFYLAAEVGLTALSLVLFLILAIALHAGEIRLFYRVPVLGISGALVFLRILHLRTKGHWARPQALAALLLTGEMAAGLHYWPLQPLTFGLLLLGTLYGMIELTDNIHKQKGKTRPADILGPALITLLFWITAFVL